MLPPKEEVSSPPNVRSDGFGDLDLPLLPSGRNYYPGGPRTTPVVYEPPEYKPWDGIYDPL